MHIVNIDAVETHVGERLTQLAFQIARRHAVRAAGDVRKTRDARFDERVFNILPDVARWLTVKGQITTFGADNQFVASKPSLAQFPQRNADRSFTSFKA